MEFKNNNTIVNLSNSILENFGVSPFHNTIPEIDKLLKGHKKVVVMLFDGMGTFIRNKHQKECSFIRSGRVHTMESTFPPTTVAATTAFLTGKFPIETGWMSWIQYFDSYKRNICVFRNTDAKTGELVRPIEEGYVLGDICPTKKMFELINEANGKEVATCLGYNAIVKSGLFKDFKNRVLIHKALKDKDEAFVYYYDMNPDHLIHEFGTTSKKVSKQIKKIDRFVKKTVHKEKDTLFIVIADHGLIDMEYIFIDDYPDFASTLVEDKPVSLEKRCPTFFVKDGEKERFVELFNKYFSEHFELFTKEEALAKHVYGDGEQNPQTNQFIGDFIAISKDKNALTTKDDKSVQFLVASHAGGTKDEMSIDISVFNV